MASTSRSGWHHIHLLGTVISIILLPSIDSSILPEGPTEVIIAEQCPEYEHHGRTHHHH